MELRSLKTFRVIIEEGSFYKAAVRLNYTQSTITNQMGLLEKELGVKLFERIGRKNVLTQEGKQLIPYVDQVLSSVKALEGFEESLAENSGEVRVGAAETMLCYKLPPIIREFTHSAPKAQLQLKSMGCHDVRDALVTGEIDIGIFYKDIGGIADCLEVREIGTYPLSCVASPETAALCSDLSTPGQVFSVPFLSNEPNCIYRVIFEEYLREQNISTARTIELWSIPTIKNLVENNLGITYLPRFTTEEEVRNGALCEIPVPIRHDEITAVCCWHKNKWISPVMQLFLDLCQQES
ncbi:MAG: LysR family transcriptional regulator [Lachnospiraceae bacterium]|nr:LysR family transcriptional regulator [Lachnospiraceae bacterium]